MAPGFDRRRWFIVVPASDPEGGRFGVVGAAA